MTRLDILHADTGKDVTSLRNIDFSTIVGVHLHHPADTLSLAGCRVQDGIALFHHARVDANKGQGTKSVVHDFERECAKWLAHVNFCDFTGRLTFFVCQRLRINFSWAW